MIITNNILISKIKSDHIYLIYTPGQEYRVRRHELLCTSRFFIKRRKKLNK